MYNRPGALPVESLFPDLMPEAEERLPEIVPARRLMAAATRLMAARDGHMQTAAVARLEVDLGGIVGDHHYGHTRRSGGREPWYPRGTEMCNERQVSLVCEAELAVIAADMGIAHIAPEWIGANMAIAGIRQFSFLPPRTQLFFAGGVTLRIDGMNAPCRLAGSAIAARYPEHDAQSLALAFPRHARRRRGLVAVVEKAGVIEAGEAVKVHVPEQWIYRP
ncbi:MOSC domain-containing protein [Pseudohoeflea coraliihabitans]|uniref:Molybdenum cofactor sulfurase n=1 Tax=Pseudohoeflea coraliihabitans TaxID=2860393 RepID=A0ABS6WJK4_9HYPH|nr:molybdenum cofactor sulfurase [Pseudohoeflea sp. DP4N28-3]MBW3095945.1 molybdenum cofactor sulfurase [Pseudohoeflea sp. DP4N28-3]